MSRLNRWLVGAGSMAVLVALFLIFPRTFAFVELAAMELRYFWWLVLLFAFVIFLLWGFRGGKRR